MAIRYSAAFLLHLRESPLCTRPENLPPPEEWMGPAPEQLRGQSKTTGDRTRASDNPLLDQTNRRPAMDRARSSANPDDIVFGPPRMAFHSARGNKGLDTDKSSKELDANSRGGLRGRNGDADGDRQRGGRNSNLRRSDTDPDGEGWSTVKPRKSFGTEGAERFHGKMGGNFRDDRRSVRDRDDRDGTRDRASKPFDTFVRDRDGGDGETRPRNGLGRSKLDTWRSSDSKEGSQPEKRDRDRTRSWRDRDREPEPLSDDRASGRTTDRRWGRDRDHRNERDPEWLDEPQVEQREAHTQQDFQKWMEQMKAAKSGNSAPAKPAAPEPATEASKRPAPAPVEAGPDKFFMAFGGSGAALDAASPSEQPKDAPSKAKPSGKSSRFTSFFSQPHQDGRAVSEGSAPLAVLPVNGPAPTVGSTMASAPAPAPEEERQAFQQLLAKLQKQSMSATPPGPSPFSVPQQGHASDSGKKTTNVPEHFQQYGRDGHDAPPHEILAPRPQQQPARPDQLLQEFAGHHQRVPSQGSLRTEVNSARNNSNTEFLMNLMRAAPDTQRADQQARMSKAGPMNVFAAEREADYLGRENRGVPRQLRPPPPPGFPMDEPFHGTDQEQRQSQPTQILQRPPPPPGLDQMPPEWMARGGQMPPPQRGPMIPPPGLAGGPSRNLPIPHGLFPPNFPPSGMPPPDAMGGMPPRNMPIPPPGFFSGPPHGFVPPGLGGFNGPPGPESHAFGGAPFEGRGVPPSNGRGASFGRP
ncbi:hypothetical protein XA68_10001 [Ophiocordyceps unilateralis]|uniref:Uncharacterized protein n=1 Tax=Ophiocordyceps unilateralis TaxID=268505 RepID=A0A2A9PV01_OPHUN|nr:hypothetical protein XA68_10001 [Ophiocordyceps unilateralis]